MGGIKSPAEAGQGFEATQSWGYFPSTMYCRVNFNALSRCGAIALRSGEAMHACRFLEALELCDADALGRITEYGNNFLTYHKVTAGDLECLPDLCVPRICCAAVEYLTLRNEEDPRLGLCVKSLDCHSTEDSASNH